MKRVPISVRPRRAAIDYSNRQCDSSGSPSPKPDWFQKGIYPRVSELFLVVLAVLMLIIFFLKVTRCHRIVTAKIHVQFPVGQISLCGLSVHPSVRPSSVSGLPLKASISSTFSSLLCPLDHAVKLRRRSSSGRSFINTSDFQVFKM